MAAFVVGFGTWQTKQAGCYYGPSRRCPHALPSRVCVLVCTVSNTDISNAGTCCRIAVGYRCSLSISLSLSAAGGASHRMFRHLLCARAARERIYRSRVHRVQMGCDSVSTFSVRGAASKDKVGCRRLAGARRSVRRACPLRRGWREAGVGAAQANEQRRC